MAHPNAHQVKDRHEKAKSLIARTGNHLGGDADMREDEKLIAEGIRQHENAEHGGKHTKLHFKSGGAVDGEGAKSHLAKRARGGSAKGKSTHVNVIVAPQGHPGAGMMPAGQPMMPPHPPIGGPPMPPPGANAQPMMPPRPPMAPPGAGAPSPGMRPPGMMKRGGGVKETSEKGVPSDSLLQAASGGKVPVEMDAGAGGAEGRIEKMHEYGEGGFKPKEHRGEFKGGKR